MTQLRAFLAIDLDDDLKPKINKVIKEFKQIDTRIKYVELTNLHLTLKFFGDIDTNGLEVLEKAIANVLDDFRPFKINIKGCGAFPNSNHIKVIWVGIEDDAILKDMHDRLLMPGLVNSHAHSSMNLLKGMGSDLPLHAAGGKPAVQFGKVILDVRSRQLPGIQGPIRVFGTPPKKLFQVDFIRFHRVG